MRTQEKFRSFFELTHDPPGRMSAGTSCPLHLLFSPKLNQPIDSELQLLTATGPMAIPLKCTIQTAEVSLDVRSPATTRTLSLSPLLRTCK